MQVDPNKRPTIHEILNSPLIRDKVTMSRFGDGGESSNGSLLEVSLVKKVSGGRGLVIDANMDDYSSIEYIVSPKSQLSNHSKHHDMPVKRIDNYTKQLSRGEKKTHKRGENLRRREASQPNLTPKGHAKIDSERKVITKNSSQNLFEKKKSNNGGGNVCFKKKTKCNQDIVKSLQEIHQFRNDIYDLQGQISHRERDVTGSSKVMEITELMPDEEQLEQKNETPLETLEQMLRGLMGKQDLSDCYQACARGGGVCSGGYGGLGGLLTLAYGLRTSV